MKQYSKKMTAIALSTIFLSSSIVPTSYATATVKPNINVIKESLESVLPMPGFPASNVSNPANNTNSKPLPTGNGSGTANPNGGNYGNATNPIDSSNTGAVGNVKLKSTFDSQQIFVDMDGLIKEIEAWKDGTKKSPSGAVQMNLNRIMLLDLIQRLDEEAAAQSKNGTEMKFEDEDIYKKAEEIIKYTSSKEVSDIYNELLKPFDILADGSKYTASYKTVFKITKVSAGTSLDAVKSLESDMLAMVDLTKATGGAKTDTNKTGTELKETVKDEAFTKQFINDYKEDMVNIINITAPKYVKWMESHKHDVSKFKDNINRWGTILSELCGAMGISIDFGGDSFTDTDSGSAIDTTSDLTAILLDEKTGNLTEIGRELMGWSACLTPLQTNVYGFENRTAMSKEARDVFDKYSKLRTPVYAIQENNVINGLRTGMTYQLGNISLRNLIDMNDKGDVVFYMSKKGQKEVNDFKKENLDNAKIEFINKSEDFIGPVYYSSNSTNLQLESIYDSLGSGSGDKNPYIEKMTKSDLYMNYALMYNHIQEGRQYLIEEELDKPLYFDFLGNVVTEGGYVVISATSNPVMFTKDTPTVMTASWINAYPRIQVQDDSRVKLGKTDAEKYSLIVTQSLGSDNQFLWNYYIAKTNKMGNNFAEKFPIFKPISKADNKADGGSVEFMPKENFLSTARAYTVASKSKIFANLSTSVSYYDGDKLRKVNLNSISNTGGTSSWNFIQGQIQMLLEANKNENARLLSEITSIIPNCSETGRNMIMVETIAKIGEENFSGMTRVMGELFEGISNGFINNIKKNGTFYSPLEVHLNMDLR